MTPADERLLAQAHAVRARGNAMPPEGMPGGLILDSWVRCARNGLQPGAPMLIHLKLDADVSTSRSTLTALREAAIRAGR